MHGFPIFIAQAESPVTEIARTFGVDWAHLGAQLISFGIVCIVLYKFAYRPVLAALEERRQLIALGKENAEKIKAELDRTEAQRQEVMAKAYEQATKSIDDARAAAAQLLDQETKKALAAAEQITVKAQEAAALNHDRMLAELKRELGRLVLQTTSAVTGKILTPEDHRRIAEETAKQLAA
jgi:F-type H+-transporting ATPase subunit b